MKMDSESQVTSLTHLYSNTHQQLSERERALYDLDSKLESTLSDLKMTRQELSSRVKELENLHQVIQSMEREATHQHQRHDELWKQKFEQFENDWREKLGMERKRSESEVRELKLKFEESQRQVEDEKLLKRKFEIEMSAEKKKLHLTLQHALSQLQNSQNDSIDRMLIKNLILKYFQQKR
jgi:hypothetical protein